jgi:hypothetical protein
MRSMMHVDTDDVGYDRELIVVDIEIHVIAIDIQRGEIVIMASMVDDDR